MSDPDYQELKLQQTELFVARQIFDELNRTHGQDLYIQAPQLNDRDIDDLSVAQDLARHEMGLKRLAEKKLIRILNPDERLRIGIHVHLVDIQAFRAFYTELFESIPIMGHSARIIYSKKTGKGKINGKSFRLNRGSRNRQVVEYLLKRPNKYLTKKQLWVIAGEKGKFDEKDPDGIIEFNNIITALREALKNVGPEHLRLKKTVMLDAEVTLTD